MEPFGGCVYVLSNPSMPGLLKIGMSEHDAFKRAEELSAVTGVPEPYVVEAYFACSDPFAAEASVHRSLAARRKPNREFFEVSLDVALSAIREHVDTPADYLRNPAHHSYGGAIHVRPRTSPPSTVGRKVRARADCRSCGAVTCFAPHRGRPDACPKCGGQLGASR
ncbi:MAG: GIY-YIG nuclease family protein [Acidobacteria bacterium]|nr:GIY-YIG nuclease family protein [Acidobacteriota bacterium]